MLGDRCLLFPLQGVRGKNQQEPKKLLFFISLIFGIRVTSYHRILWWGWGIFQLTLAGRIASSTFELMEWRKFFGVANGWVILGMFALMAGIVIWKIYYQRPLTSQKPL